MSETKPKVLNTKVPEPKFIRFTELQRKYVTEVRNRVEGELNMALKTVYEELGILEKIEKAPPGMYKVRMSDCSGLDVFPPRPQLLKPEPPADPPKGDKPPPPLGKKPEDQIISKEEGEKDN